SRCRRAHPVSLTPAIVSRDDREGIAMSARELTITILGLIATFCMPWPAGPKQAFDAAPGPIHAHSASANPCEGAAAEGVAARRSERPGATFPELAQAAAP